MLDQKLIDWARESMKQGATAEQIYQHLLAEGFSVAQVQDILDASKSESRKAESQKRAVSIIAVIGSILIGLGIFSFIASNWQSFQKGLKIFIILVSMLLAYAGGWYLREKKDLRKSGAALYLLGSIVYGAGIFLVAQIFNIRANWPDGFILWMLGVVVVALATELSAFLYFAAVLGIISIFGNPFTIFENFSG